MFFNLIIEKGKKNQTLLTKGKYSSGLVMFNFKQFKVSSFVELLKHLKQVGFLQF